MDYEKKYNEAFAWIRDIYPTLTGAAKEDAQHYFPELRESEDERIINQLIALVNSTGEVLLIPTNKEELVAWLNKCKDSLHISETCKENADSFTSEDERIIRAIIDALYSHTNSINLLSSRGYQMENIEAWLEKQKYDLMKPVYDNQDSFESALEKAWKDYNDSGARTVDGCEDNYVECAHAKGFREGYLFGIEKQKEHHVPWYDYQKSKEAGYTIVPNEEYEQLIKQKEQKPALSEVELLFRGEKVTVKRPFYRDNKGRGYSTTEEDEETAWNALRAWCEKKGISLYDLYPKAEWSEEDADMLNCCISSIEEAKENRYAYKETDGDTSYDREIDWLKSLRPSWKPSEEEMKALDVACSGKLWYGEIYLNGLRRIREQLKKL